MEWSNDLSLQLIEAYRDRPVLWDVSHNYYKLANRRNEAWADIGKLFSCDVMEVKKKMNSLLSSFRRERQKEGLRRSGAGPEEVYHSTWFAFNSLKFLFDRYRPRRHRHNFEDEDGDYEGEDFITDEEPDIPTDVLKMEYSEDSPVAGGDGSVLERFSGDGGDKKPGLKRKRAWSEESRLADACGLLKAAVAAGALQRDDCAVYGEHVANKLRALDHRTRAIVQHAVNNVLFEADMGKYSEHFQPAAYYECAAAGAFPPAWAPPSQPQAQQAAAAAAAAAAMMCPPQAPAGAQAHASPTAAPQPPHQSPRA